MNYACEIKLDEIKKIELDILRYVGNICNEYNLRYSLSGGTLIGAIRHKGFIPWDDDIDIMMPRDDYDKFIDILQRKNEYTCLSMINNKEYFYAYAKVVDKHTKLIENDNDIKINNIGVYVDVFPIDGLPVNKKKLEKHVNTILNLRKMQNLSMFSNYPKTTNIVKQIVTPIIWRLSRFVGWKRWIELVDKLGRKYKFDESIKVACLVAGYGKKELISRLAWEYKVSVMFEECNFMAIKGYDEYLTNLYGDYMQLPPVDKRISHHNMKAYRN